MICFKLLFRTNQYPVRNCLRRDHDHAPAPNLFLRSLLFLLCPTRNPNGDDQHHKDDDTKLPKLRPSDPPQDRDIGQWEEPKPVSNDVPSLGHTAVPGVTNIELIGGGDIQEQIPQGCLQRIEREIEEIKRHDCEADSRVGDINGSFRIPITLPCTEQVNEEPGDLFAIGEGQSGHDEHGGGRGDPVSAAILGRGRIRNGAYWL